MLAGSKKSRIPSEKLKSCSASCLDGVGLPNFIQYQFVSWTAMPTDGQNHICGTGLHLVKRVLVTRCHVDIMVKLDFGQLCPGHRCLGGLYSSQFDLRRSYLDS